LYFGLNKSTVHASLASAFILVGCGEPADDGPGEANTDRATLQGSSNVDTANDGAFEGAVVTAFRVDADGTLSELGSSELDAQGRYGLTFDIDEATEGRQQLVVELESAQGDRVGAVALERVVADGGVYVAAPIDDETSAEARVLTAARAGAWAEGYPLALLRQSVDAELAAQLQANDDQASYDRVAAAVTAGVRAHYDVLEDAEADRVAIDASLERAEVDLDAALDAAADDVSATQDARVEFTSDVVAAYDDAGVTLARSSQSFQARAEAATRSSADLDAALRARLIARVERDRAAFTGRFVESVTSTPASARAELDSSLAATATAGANAAADADAAWETYSNTASSSLDADLAVAVSAALDGLFVSLDDTQDVYFDSVAQAEGDADAIAEAIVDAQADARGDFFTEANLAVLTGAGLSGTDAEAVLEVTYQLSLTADASMF
jgi:hypothetical protein